MRTPWCTSSRSLRPRRMPTVSSTDGSPTYTCWKRRSRAASFSMYLRYSSSVVAPTRRSSPRASIGLIMLPASIADSPVAPAPTMVCSSSMKVMIWPAEFLMSSRTALSRSSNSPRYLAPATIEPRSRETTVLSRRLSGTSPATMRWARPSTMAVLPTPGSPISTGLFLVRRLSTWTTRRISLSRPITGSNSFARAFGQVGGVLLQRLIGRLGVGAGDAGAAANLDERVAQRLRRCAMSGQQFGDLGVTGGQSDHQMLGGDVFVIHLGGQLLRGGDGSQRFTRKLRLRVGAAGLRQPVQDALRSVRIVAGSTPTASSSGAAIPSFCVSRASSR